MIEIKDVKEMEIISATKNYIILKLQHKTKKGHPELNAGDCIFIKARRLKFEYGRAYYEPAEQ